MHPLGRRRGVRALWGFATGAGLAGIATIAGSVGFVRVTSARHLYSEEDVPPASVVLVLGAKVYPDGTPSAFLAARLDLARRLFEAGKVKVILVSGDNMAPEYNEPEAMRDYLINTGVPADKVIADYAGLDTYNSCARAKRIFDLSELIIVTQSYHVPRAVATGRALGIDARGVGDDTVRRSMPWRRGAIRDQLACVKTVIDLLTRRDPVLGRRETGVADALAR